MSKQTKTETVRTMLTQPDGASLDAICNVTGWQPHSARAALSGFRKAGYQIERLVVVNGETATKVYRITGAPKAAV